MSIARGLFDLRMAGTYLPSLLLLVIKPDIPWFNAVIGLSLLGAVYLHGISRYTFGVGGPEENPQEMTEAVKNIQIALTGRGPREELPGSIVEMIISILRNPLQYGLWPLVFMAVGFVSLLVFFPSIFVSLYFATIQFDGLGTAEQVLVFAGYVWVAQWLVWRFYTPAYLLDEDDFK